MAAYIANPSVDNKLINSSAMKQNVDCILKENNVEVEKEKEKEEVQSCSKCIHAAEYGFANCEEYLKDLDTRCKNYKENENE